MPDQEDLHVDSGWEARYQRGDTPWDLGAAPPVLEDLLVELGPSPLRVLVPGAGTGQDALAWARAGHTVTAVDIAPSAIAALRAAAAEAGLRVRAEVGDLFALPEGYGAAFDAVWEQTCFCAIQPGQRAAYVRAMAAALRPQGWLYGLFWNHGMEGGPPHDVSPEQVTDLFLPTFELRGREPVRVSAGTRSNEFLVRLQRAR